MFPGNGRIAPFRNDRISQIALIIVIVGNIISRNLHNFNLTIVVSRSSGDRDRQINGVSILSSPNERVGHFVIPRFFRAKTDTCDILKQESFFFLASCRCNAQKQYK